MKVESLIRREGGSLVTVGGVDYRFEPDESGRHVAVVTNPEHLGKLLAIREGYRLVADAEPDTMPNEAVTAAIAKATSVLGSEGSSSEEEPESDGAAANAEPTPEPEPEQEDSGQDEPEQEAEAAPAPEPESDGELDRDALAKQFHKKFGRPPHYKWDAKRIAAELEAE